MYWTAAPLNLMVTKKALLKEGLFDVFKTHGAV